MDFWFHNNFTPAESIFAVGLVVVVFAAMFLLRDEVDSPRGLVLRGLLMSVFFLQASLFSVLAWEFSPRADIQATVVARNWTNADDNTPAKVTFAKGDGAKITLRLPGSAMNLLNRGEVVDVTYLTWSNRVVALREVNGDAMLNFRLSALGADLKAVAETYLVGAAVLGAGLCVLFWIRRKDDAPALMELTDTRKD